jgi:ketosteroid isomerase-like protein
MAGLEGNSACRFGARSNVQTSKTGICCFSLLQILFVPGGDEMTRAFLIVLLALPAVAQNGPCTEQFIKATENGDYKNFATDDVYFFSGALDKPVVGVSAREKAGVPIAASRKNENQGSHKPDRIVVSPSGDMAYEYGTSHMSFDSKKEGKHVDFTAAYLSVWKAVDGKCKLAAQMAEPEGQ